MDKKPISGDEVSSNKLYDLLILGGGPAGLNAAIYASRKGLDVIVLSMNKGGQLNDTALIENYLGTEGVLGYEMAERFSAHVQKFNVPVIERSNIIKYSKKGINHEVELSTGDIYTGKSVIIATGSIYRPLNVDKEYEYVGRGVSYCAICDAPLFRNKDAIVVGGGNAAVEAALDLAKHSKSVTVLHRSQFRADKVLLDQMFENEKITYHLRTKINEIIGGELLQGVVAVNLDTGEERIFNGDGLFIEIGQIPNSDPYKGIIEMTDAGAIITDNKLSTNVPGVFAAGNIRDFPYKQIIIAAADGAIAALSVCDYLNQKYDK